ncbi:hypothetical protein [Parasphingorhabdus cellanae]|uniref:DUF4261 domain-containing protein n=1 Tax=Parasphingorhabdus cellanae TaxID=2806553 RepID=A0ABX7T7J5_9SPHN|nr:hypothetical protein [Parasphingorhabdus cellanae]QTD56429.1 hypothetical protein J4G78_02170 [Parasphingorhabdus cellanae]
MMQDNPPLLIMVPLSDSFRLPDLTLPDDVANRVILNRSKYPDLKSIEAVVGGMSFHLTHHLAQDNFQHFSADKLNHIFCIAPESPMSAIGITLSEHIANAKHDSTINRTFLELARIIGKALNATSVIWQPAKLHIGFEYFAEASQQYITGGPFPVLIQIAISESSDGKFQTFGLSYFSEQEIRLSAPTDYPANQVIKRLVRIAHDIATNGRIDTATEAQGFVPGETLSLSPSADLSIVDIAIAAGPSRQLL